MARDPQGRLSSRLNGDLRIVVVAGSCVGYGLMPTRFPRIACSLVLAVVAVTPSGWAETKDDGAGGLGIRQSVQEIMGREKSGSARQRLRKLRPESKTRVQLSSLPRTRAGESKPIHSQPSATTATSAAVVVGTSFDAARYADSGSVPPDSMGDIGPTQFLLCLNGRIRTFSRAGVMDGALDTTTANFFDAVRGDGDTADPRVRYDRLSGRWFVSMLSYETPTRLVMAVSSNAAISSATSFTFFQFSFSEVGTTPNSDTGCFFDFDTLGVDRHALYIGGNVFSPQVHPPSYVGSTGFVVNKANLLAGSLSVTAFRQMASSAGGGPFTPQGVDQDDANSTEGYFIGRDISSNNHLIIRRVSDPGGTPSLSANISLTIPPTAQPKGGVLALGSTFPLSDLDDRLFQARLHRGHLVTGHNIEVNGAGNADSGGERDGVRWYDIVGLTGTPVLAQSGTLFDAASTNPRSYWMPAGVRSGQGHLAIAGNVASTTEYPQIAAALRLNTDPPGTLGTPGVVQSGNANSNDLKDQFNQHRWGDYSTMSVDPNDDMTFWTVQEYSNAPDSWTVRVIQIKPPSPAAPASAVPSTLVRGQFDSDVVITGTAPGGSGFFDPGTEYANHLTAVVNGGGITVNRVTYSDPTHLTLNVTVASNAALGARTVSVTNPDGQSISSGAGLLTINASTDADADGIPDWWMQKYFGHSSGQAADRSRAGDDADGDGFTNLQEWSAHTNPRDATSALRVVSINRETAGVHITFTSVVGKFYRIEWKNSLASPTWTMAANNIEGLEGSTTAIALGATAPRFYRVVAID
jgi:hypothetical protein